MRRAILLLLLCVYLFGRIRDSHDGVVRESPIDFSSLRERTNLASWLPHQPVRGYNGTHIDERYRKLSSRALDSGKQGTVQIYVDTAAEMNISVVVKTISAPSRNGIPVTLLPAFRNFTDRWPSELEAALALGPRTSKGQYAFVPVHDYFILRDLTSTTGRWSWALVTELIAGGTIEDLAGRVHSNTSSTADQVDLMFRSSLDRLLANLRWLHNDGYCHDDVKLGNIFARGPGQWLLGDLGNTRDVQHAWHTTRLWKRRNKWYVPSCQADDVRRALKAYMNFLRLACCDRAQFDWELRAGNAAWSKLYWSFVDGDSPADEAISISEENRPSTNDGDGSAYSGSFLLNLARKLLVDQEMKWNSNLFKLWILP